MSDPYEKTRQRRDDQPSSSEGASNVSRRAPTQKVRLLRQFFRAVQGLTDEEAAAAAGLLDSCYWKRCNELRQDEYIHYVDEYRKGKAGVSRRVSMITRDGMRKVARHV